jgi:hypothetical protein
MSSSNKLRVALLRNRQIAGKAAFLQEMLSANGPIPDCDSFIKAEECLTLMDNLESPEMIRRRSRVRESELKWEGVESALQRFISIDPNAICAIIMSHFEPFAFWSQFAVFAQHAFTLVSFDEDAVIAVSGDLRRGFGIDRYTSELSHTIRYSIDVWN